MDQRFLEVVDRLANIVDKNRPPVHGEVRFVFVDGVIKQVYINESIRV